MHQEIVIREAKRSEFVAIGQLMVSVYSQLEGFPSPQEQPTYYQLLARIGNLTNNPGTKLLVAQTTANKIAGAVVYIGNMQFYGSGGIAPQEKNAAGFRLLAVNPTMRGLGIGKKLVVECIRLARQEQQQIIIHSTQAMQTAWTMYEALGFKTAKELDFMQGELRVYGFRLSLI